ncbi:globin domain-containing protein [Roseovarius phycicola]|uniref:Globin domain-containing protein n=1 Tax=Roseovarius phycicola TaxID=3080976 RepID=A0ABZ2HF48_9RHOB
MPMSAADIELVQRSFAHVRAELETHSDVFYAALFERAPNLRDLFREDLEGQGMKFMTTLRFVVSNLGDHAAMDDKLGRLGEAHASLGVKAADFDPMEDALIDTIRNALQELFTPQVEAAWRSAYGEARDTMVRVGGIANQ